MVKSWRVYDIHFLRRRWSAFVCLSSLMYGVAEDVVMLYDYMFLRFYIAFNTIAFEAVSMLFCLVYLQILVTSCY